MRDEALPCTEPAEPINFEIYSAGPEIDEIPLTHFVRRCDTAVPAPESPANYTSYVYGRCEIEEGATGCQPPLEIQSFPACQRSLADYSYEGRPLPYRILSGPGEAEMVEISFFLDDRIEIYTGSTTIVIYATDPALAEEAVASLESQRTGARPAATADELAGAPDAALSPPVDGAVEGTLPCRV